MAFTFLLAAWCAAVASAIRSVQWNAREDPHRPVSKVIDLLQGMLSTLEEEQEQDEDAYDKTECWCETAEGEKTQAITDAEVHITQTGSQIDSLTAGSAELTTVIESLEIELNQSMHSLQEATRIRMEGHDNFIAEEKDLTESITSLKAAIVVLEGHQEGLFLQQGRGTRMMSIGVMVQEQMRRHAALLKGKVTPAQRRTLEAFVQVCLGQQPKPEYESQSGDVYGVLQEMLETFEGDLVEAQEAEALAKEQYDDLQKTSVAGINHLEAQIDAKSLQKAETDQANVLAKQDLADTQATMSADETYLATARDHCNESDAEWEVRQATRQEEMVAVTQALQILSADDAHDTFTRTFNPAFFLQEASVEKSRRSRAAALLANVTGSARNPKLSSLAVMVKLDNFTEVKEAIDSMIAALSQQKADEIAHKDSCIGNLSGNELETEGAEHEKEDLFAQIDYSEASIKQLEKEIEELNSSIADMDTELKRAGENRELENQEFHTTIADQHETQRLLVEAKSFLSTYYHKTLFLQKRTKQEPADAPEGFDEYEDHQAAPGVVALIDQVISDAEQMEADTTRAEEDSQKAYEDFVQATNDDIQTNQDSIQHKTKAKATAELQLETEKESLESTQLTLDSLSSHEAHLHSNCDFVLDNFDLRQTAFDEEMEALRSAKAILSGSLS